MITAYNWTMITDDTGCIALRIHGDSFVTYFQMYSRFVVSDILVKSAKYTELHFRQIIDA